MLLINNSELFNPILEPFDVPVPVVLLWNLSLLSLPVCSYKSKADDGSLVPIPTFPAQEI